MSLKEYEDLLNVLPLSTIEYAFAYGSGALQQKGENKTEKMVDFILSTNDPIKFHTENIEKNASHYSLLRYLGAKTVAKFQSSCGARVYYNTRVLVGSRRMKYGIVATEDLNKDLLDWRWLYTAGRLHKPVLDATCGAQSSITLRRADIKLYSLRVFLVVRPTTAIEQCLEENRRSALQAALLLLPDSFSLEDLYQKIVSLSYTGDFRMVVGEDKNKVKKIVQGSFEELSNVYDPILAHDPKLVVQNGKVLFSLAHRHDVSLHVEGAVSSIVAPAALSQSLKNAASAGFYRTVVYSFTKLSKMMKSLGR